MKVAVESVLDILEGLLIFHVLCQGATSLGVVGLIRVGGDIKGKVGDDAFIVVKNVGDSGGILLIVGEVVKEVGHCCYKMAHYISVLQL